jgi:predicted PurR-regulated permease PerM
VSWTRTLVVSATIILLAIIVVGAIWLLSWVGPVVLLLLLAGLLSTVLMPLVDWLERGRPIPRPLAVLVSYLAVLIVFGGILYLVIPPLVDQANQLVQGLPDMYRNLTAPDSTVRQLADRLGIDLTLSGQSNLGTQLQALARAVLTNAAVLVRDVTSTAVGIVVVLVVSFYLLNEGHDFRARLNGVVPERYHDTLDYFLEAIIGAVGGYARAQLAVAAMVGVLAGLAAWIVGVRYPLIIGALAGLLELIPFFGPTLGAAPAVLIAIFQGSWLRVALIIVAFIIIQQIESNIIGPRLLGHGVGLHPLVVIVAVLIGIEVAGVWGALFAVPATAVLVSVGRRVYQMSRERPRRMAA